MEQIAALNTQLLLDWKKIESQCNMKLGDCQTRFESDLTSNSYLIFITEHLKDFLHKDWAKK